MSPTAVSAVHTVATPSSRGRFTVPPPVRRLRRRWRQGPMRRARPW
ncbi:hypothetical protein BJY18_005230 [Amycolatopsis jiangsuensis]|uniref:Uncharacterized protein n=1 Tax=Amycolatopsis jiangsuensis TaxID=1181879 RepID=A0A840J276_9PSEU|nr:hypothetical protein [Amycolatopsis jiangsuensis]